LEKIESRGRRRTYSGENGEEVFLRGGVSSYTIRIGGVLGKRDFREETIQQGKKQGGKRLGQSNHSPDVLGGGKRVQTLMSSTVGVRDFSTHQEVPGWVHKKTRGRGGVC